MDSKSETYCRLCAESKYEMLDLSTDDDKCMDIVKKLSYMNAAYIDLSDDTIPKTICFLCSKSLQEAYDFLNKVEKAQVILKECISKKTLNSDHIYEEELNEPADSAESVQIKCEPSNNDISFTDDLNVKSEPEDIFDGNQNNNVQDTLDAILFDEANTSTNTIEYIKQLLVQSNNVPTVEAPVSPNVPNVEASPCDVGTDLLPNVKTWKDYSWLCSDCKTEFTDASELRMHVKEEHKKCFAFACGDCYAIPTAFEEFLAHARRHRRYLRFCCPYCDVVTKNSISYKKHITAKHLQSSAHVCKSCGELFATTDSIENHRLQYSTLKPSRRRKGVPYTTEELTCKHCNKVLKSRHSLREHSKLHDNTIERIRNHTCDRCGKAFYTKDVLSDHLKSHNKIKPHVCKLCNKSFLHLHILRNHVRSHLGIKPFSCDQCDKCFRLKKQLNNHKIIHTDSMPFKCKHCEKCFRYQQPMQVHELQHTGARPYVCKFCPMDFTNWPNCNKHMKRRHGTDTAKKKNTPDGLVVMNPETGQPMKIPDTKETEEWKTNIMLPYKRGKKTVNN